MAMHPILNPMRFFNPIRLIPELIYTTIIVIFCYLIYHKTKEIYNLTKYKGIHYFRNTFLFFALAYASRFILHLLFIGGSAFDIFLPRGIFMPIVMVPVGYLSTMAIFYLMYSVIWKKIKNNHFLIFSNIIAILVSIIAFISRSPQITTFVQFILIVFTLIMIFTNPKKHKKLSQIKVLYILLFLFWLFNMYILGPRRFLAYEMQFIFQMLSLVVFFIIYNKVTKWVK